MAAQKFGGAWSVVKLDDVAAYLKQFNNALKFKRFERVYIDAFAGSGDMTFQVGDALPLLDEAEEHVVVAGSAKRALATEPPFHKLHFIDRKKRNVMALRQLCAGTDAARTSVHHGDANDEVTKICLSLDRRMVRGVIFLDPFGNHVSWKTLETVAKQYLDVWYLFPLCGIYRNAPIDRDKLTAEKKKSITSVLGTEDWLERFYEPPPNAAATLFDMPAPKVKRSLDVRGIEGFVSERLNSIFPLVLAPKQLPAKGAPLFSLFFAMGNPDPVAQGIATRIAGHLLKR